MKKAFTLIELLVVIAIIAILAAILFPVFAQAKEAAKSTQCLSNMKNVMTASIMYAGDYDDQAMGQGWWGISNAPNPGLSWPAGLDNNHTGTYPTLEPGSRLAGIWANVIQPYVKNKDILMCPDFSRAQLQKAMDAKDCDGNGATGSADALGGANYSTGDSSIVPNGGLLSAYSVAFWATSGPNGQTNDGSQFQHCIYGDGSGTVGTLACPYFAFGGASWEYDANSVYTAHDLSLSSISRPAETVFVGEGVTEVIKLASNGQTRIGAAMGCEGQGRHKSTGSNYAFHDGHAKYLGVNSEDVLDKDGSGNYYLKYWSYNQ